MQFKEREASKEHFKEGYLSLIPQGNSGQKKKSKQDEWLPGPPTNRIMVFSSISQSYSATTWM